MLRVAVIGCGSISEMHLRSYAASGRARIVAVADTLIERARTRSAPFHARSYSDYRKLLAGERLDAVSICTPPCTHCEIAVASLKHGLHVLCEKPLAMTLEEGKYMVKVAKDSDVNLMTGFCNRFYPPVAKAKDWIDQGKLGPLHHFRMRFAGLELMKGSWLAEPSQGGGLMFESAGHYVDMFRFLIGEVKDLYAKSATRAQEISGSDTVALLVESVGGVFGTLEGSWSSPHSEKRIEVYGERGAIVIDYITNRSRFSLDDGTTEWIETEDAAYERFHWEINHFLDCVEGKSDPIVTGEDGIESMRTVNLALHSAKEGRVVRLKGIKR